MFVKEAHSPKIISRHQNLTHWGLDDAEEVTFWVAISEAPVEAVCMKFVPGSHKQRIVAHIDTFSENNLLSRGQEISVNVREEDAVRAALKVGQASMHHGHFFTRLIPTRHMIAALARPFAVSNPQCAKRTAPNPWSRWSRGRMTTVVSSLLHHPKVACALMISRSAAGMPSANTRSCSKVQMPARCKHTKRTNHEQPQTKRWSPPWTYEF